LGSAPPAVILVDDQRRTEVVPNVIVSQQVKTDTRRPRVTVGQAQIAGTVAAGVALGVGELITGFSTKGQSLVGSVGAEFVDQAGGDVARTAISIFNTADKPALVAGIVIISLLIGAGLG